MIFLGVYIEGGFSIQTRPNEPPAPPPVNFPQEGSQPLPPSIGYPDRGSRRRDARVYP